jgi:hypothetical protein
VSKAQASRWTATLAGLVLVTVACSSTEAAPVFAPTQVANPSSEPSCNVERASDSGKSVVLIDPRSIHVTATWIPGMNDPTCSTRVTTGGGALARQLAHDIDRARRFPSGTYNCPNDSGVGVRLIFGYVAKRSELADIELEGCGGITAPDRGTRMLTQPVRRDLRAIAPPHWRQNLPLR